MASNNGLPSKPTEVRLYRQEIRMPKKRTNNAELAELYEANAGDVSGWEEKSIQMRVRSEGPSHTFAVRFTAAEMQKLQASADEVGVTITDFIRAASLQAAHEKPESSSASTQPGRGRVR
jgi:hypothetical protein